MTFWAIGPQDGMLVGHVLDEKLSMELTQCGISPLAMRNAFSLANAKPVDMQVARPSAAMVEKERQEIPDLVIWSWIAIFSNRAALMAIELGCEAEEFWPCQFRSNPDERFFFHLPIKTFDIDIDKSTFRHFLPVEPPIPVFIERLMLRQLSGHVPPCFRIEIPRTRQVFSELIVREDFKTAWEEKAFRGAEFRLLS